MRRGANKITHLMMEMVGTVGTVGTVEMVEMELLLCAWQGVLQKIIPF